jgi:phosphoribosylanthranilate isomerase
MTWLKICGITRIEDAILIESLGVDAIGFIFAPSPRRVTLAKALEISRSLSSICKVGVFVDTPLEQVVTIRKTLSLDMVQLHGRESPEYCKNLGGVIIKALRPRDESELDGIDRYSMTWKLLLDAFVTGRMGGTGKMVDGTLLEKIVSPDRFILAGGIGVENAVSIIQHVMPFGLDCNSSLETNPGIKDSEKILEIVKLVKGMSGR